MSIFTQIFEFIVHMDSHASELIVFFGAWSYVIIFMIIFSETGLVITPFLPGESLLFVTGAICIEGDLNIFLVVPLMIIAAILGNMSNYLIGRAIGHRIFDEPKFRIFALIIKKDYIHKTHDFYEKHGAIAVAISRFYPIVRTFTPFVAGIGQMNFSKFMFFNTIGGSIWALLYVLGGYFFGNLPFVRTNFVFIILALVTISIIPSTVNFIIGKLKKRKK